MARKYDNDGLYWWRHSVDGEYTGGFKAATGFKAEGERGDYWHMYPEGAGGG
jgi:hypothetical protein